MVYPKVTTLRERRIKAGFSMRGLAMKAGVHYATVSNVERTGHNVTPATAKALCDALHAPFDDLFTIAEASDPHVQAH